MMTSRPSLTVIAAALAASVLGLSPAGAQETDELPRQYTVEVIVFTYEQEVSTGNEIFLPDEPEPATQSIMPDFFIPGFPGNDPGAVEGSVIEPEPIDEEEQPVETIALPMAQYEPEYLLTPEPELGMQEIADTLRRLPVYRPILHTSWTQDALPEEDAIVMQLDMLDEPPEELTGSFKLYLSRFLHLVVDLEYEIENGPRAPVAIETPPGGSLMNDDVRFRIDEDRIFRRGETRYFDHPKFGVVARVTLVEEPEEDEEENSADDLPSADQLGN